MFQSAALNIEETNVLRISMNIAGKQGQLVVGKADADGKTRRLGTRLRRSVGDRQISSKDRSSCKQRSRTGDRRRNERTLFVAELLNVFIGDVRMKVGRRLVQMRLFDDDRKVIASWMPTDRKRTEIQERRNSVVLLGTGGDRIGELRMKIVFSTSAVVPVVKIFAKGEKSKVEIRSSPLDSRGRGDRSGVRGRCRAEPNSRVDRGGRRRRLAFVVVHHRRSRWKGGDGAGRFFRRLWIDGGRRRDRQVFHLIHQFRRDRRARGKCRWKVLFRNDFRRLNDLNRNRSIQLVVEQNILHFSRQRIDFFQIGQN